MVLQNFGQAQLRLGAIQQAVQLFQESLMLAQELNDYPGIALCLIGLGGVSIKQGQLRRACQLLGAVEALVEAIGQALEPPESIDYAENVATLRSQLAADVFAAAWAEGRALSLEQLLADVLAQPPEAPAATGLAAIANGAARGGGSLVDSTGAGSVRER